MAQTFYEAQEIFLRERIKLIELQREVFVDLRSADLEIKSVIDDLENAIFRLRKAANTLGDLQDE